MSLKSSLVIYAVALILSVTACTHQELSVDSTNLVLSQSQIKELAEADEIGVNHNRALDYLASHSDLRTVTNEEKYLIINEFYLSIAKTDEARAALNTVREKGCATCGFNQSSIPEWVQMNRSRLTDKEASYLLEMGTALELYNNGGSTKVADALKALEKRIVADPELANAKAILGTSAILRYSIQYWDSSYSDVHHPFYPVINRDINFRTCWYCIQVALTDAFSYQDCLYNSGITNPNTAAIVCQNQAAYTSSLYY